MWRAFLPWILALAACPAPRPAADPCAGAGARLAAAERDLADGYLHRARDAARTLARCGEREAGRLEARALAELGLDAEAIAAWRRWSEDPGASGSDRSAAAAAIAGLRERPSARRTATPEEQATALALYRDGVTLRLQGNHAAALRQLRRAYALSPHPLTIVQIAATHQAAGDERAARMAGERALAIAESTRRVRAEPRVAGAIGVIRRLAFSADGRRLLAVDTTGRLRGWDTRSGRPLFVHAVRPPGMAPEDVVDLVAVDPSASRVASLVPAGTGVWDVDTGRLLQHFPGQHTALAFLAGDRVAVAGDRSVRIQPLAGGQGTALPGAPAEVRALASDAGGQVLAALEGIRLHVWRVDQPQAPVTIDLPDSAERLAVSPDGAWIAVGTGDDAHLIDWRAGRVVRSVEASGSITDLAVDRAGRVVTAAYDLAAWDAQGTVATDDHPSLAVAWSPDGQAIATAGIDFAIHLLEVPGGRELRRFGADVTLPISLAVSPDGGTLASGDVTGKVTVRDLTDGAVTRVLRPYRMEMAVLGLAISPDGRQLASGIAAGGGEPAVHLWELPGLRERASGGLDVGTLAFSGDGSRLYGGAAPLGGSLADVWLVSGYALRKAGRESGALQGGDVVAVDPSGTAMAYAREGKVRLVPARGAAPVALPGSAGEGTPALGFSPDGRSLAAATAAGPVLLWDLRRRAAPRTLAGTQPPLSLAWSPDGRHLAIGHHDGKVSLFTVATGALRRLPAHETVSRGLAWLADGRLLTSGMDGAVRLWDVDRAVLLATLVSGADGRWLVVAADGRVDGSPGADGGASLLYWQVGDVQLPGFVAWSRQHAPGLLRQLTTRPRESR